MHPKAVQITTQLSDHKYTEFPGNFCHSYCVFRLSEAIVQYDTLKKLEMYSVCAIKIFLLIIGRLNCTLQYNTITTN